MNNWKEDHKWSIKMTDLLVIPLIKRFELLKGDFKQTQQATLNNTMSLDSKLDVCSGVDLWQIARNGIVRTIAIRVQKVDRYENGYRTFTIRKTRYSGTKTELDKLKDADEKEDIVSPDLHIHAYVNEDLGIIWRVLIARTEDIYDLIKKDYGYDLTNRSDGNIFTCLDFKHIEAKYKYGLYEFNGQSGQFKVYDVNENLLPRRQETLFPKIMK